MWKTGRVGQRKNRRPTQCAQQDDDGVDLNRNYDVCFSEDSVGSSTEPCQEDYRGPQPFSEPETVAIKRFVEQHVVAPTNSSTNARLTTDLATSLNYHSFGRYFNIPFACQARGTPNASSLARFNWMAQEMTTFNRFGYGQPWKDSNLYTVNGETSDWMWAKHGIFAMSPEVGPAFSTQPSDRGFWPPRKEVPHLALELHYSNLIAARVAGPMLEIDVRRVSVRPTSSSSGTDQQIVDVAWVLRNDGLRSRDVDVIVTSSIAAINVTADQRANHTVLNAQDLATTWSRNDDNDATLAVGGGIERTSSLLVGSVPASGAIVLHVLVRSDLDCQYVRILVDTNTQREESGDSELAFEQYRALEMPPCGVCSRHRPHSSDEDPRCRSVEDLVTVESLVAALKPTTSAHDAQSISTSIPPLPVVATASLPPSPSATPVSTPLVPSASPTSKPTTAPPTSQPTAVEIVMTSQPPVATSTEPSVPSTPPVAQSTVPQFTSETDASFMLVGSAPPSVVPIWGAALSFSVLLVVVVVWRRRRWRLASNAARNTQEERRHKYSRVPQSTMDDRAHNPFAVNIDSDSSEEDSEGEEAEYGRRRHRGRGLQGGGGDDDA
ncbi:hypothetical protein PINS_up005853 [Pythium insidiosum]|nr:hypothetical protein PINS_up005853 [Pythium insidiosum]